MIDKAFFKDSRPWRVYSGSIYSFDGTPIAHMDRETGNGTSPTERDQNAHLIVDAVNAYDIDDEQRIAREARQALAHRGALITRQEHIEYALADIRLALKDGTHDGTAYEKEKMEERDNLLTEWHQVTKDIKLIG